MRRPATKLLRSRALNALWRMESTKNKGLRPRLWQPSQCLIASLTKPQLLDQAGCGEGTADLIMAWKGTLTKRNGLKHEGRT